MRHLLTTEGLERCEIESYLDDAAIFSEVLRRPIPKVPALRGKTVATLFFEASTRTRMSFEKAAKALSADTMSFSPGTSSLKKGESLKDTVLTIEAMGLDLMVVRHEATGAPWRVADWASVPVVNGGDGCHQHPTQALLDCLTLRQRFGKLDGCKDSHRRGHPTQPGRPLRHPRHGGARGRGHAGGATDVAPARHRRLAGSATSDLDEALTGLDAVYLLRVQAERGGASVFPSFPEYRRRFGMTRERLAGCRGMRSCSIRAR